MGRCGITLTGESLCGKEDRNQGQNQGEESRLPQLLSGEQHAEPEAQPAAALPVRGCAGLYLPTRQS